MHLLAFAVFLVCAYATRGFIIPSPGSSPYQNIISQTQYSKRDDNSTVAQQRADAVKEAFEFAWDGYFSNCKGQDELLPVTDTCGNPRDHWGASAVDALSTAIVMEIQPIVSDIVLYITTIDFTTSETEVSLFETTIRYLAGMLAGYDLLKGPLSNLTTNASAVDALLTQSKSLADTLSYAFNTTTGIPFNNLFLTNHTTDGSTTNTLATIGSLVLEWQHLSDLTGNTTYGTLAQKAESYLLSPQPTYSVPFPGLLGSTVAVSNGSFLDATGGWNGGDDSFYEYLLKMYVYDSSRYGNYRDHWTSAADSTMKYLAFNPVSRPDLTFLASYVNTSFVNASEHLTCFDGGNFLLGGQVLGRQDYIDFGLKLVDGCHDTYTSTATGIGPEQFSWNTTGVNSKNQAPEVIESFYYAYRITGDAKYQDWAWDAFVAINATCRTGSGFSSISDVDTKGGGSFNNEQESFLFAEVMKYSYLIHAPDNVFQVASHNGTNQFVFNTEAHPFKVAGPPV